MRHSPWDIPGWPRAALLIGLFALSGATSLVYQILWVRELSQTLGSTVGAIAIVVSGFMGGLALGSALLGPLGDRSRSPLFLYGLLEAGIGLCALILPVLFELVSRGSATRLHAPVDASEWLPFGASLLIILVPTTLMGGTLPVLGRYVASFSLPRGKSLGLLYAANTFGAVVGTLATGFFLVRTIGVANSTFLAAALNLAVAAASFGLARAWRTTATIGAVPARSEPAIQSRPPDGSMRRAVLLLYFVNGFAGLGLQILWTRAFSLFGTNTTYAFTVVLTTFLLGLAGGSVMGSTLASGRQARPGLLAALQSLLALVAAITPACLGLVGVDIFSSVEEKIAAIGQAGKILSACVIAGLFMLPATVLMGACFPLVAQILAGSTDRVGRVLGRAYALNTLGAVAGSLIAAFVLLPWIGIEYSILVIASITAASGLFLALRARAALSSALSLAALFGTLALMLTTPGHFRAMLEQKLGQTLVFYREGIEATIGVFESDRARRPVLVINNAVLEDRGVVHKLLAHLPALLHPDPQRALVLGFGVGITSKAFAAHGLPVNDCVEISPGVIDAAPFFGDLNGQIIERGDESFRLFVADGRKLLRAGGEPYDIIALDANSGDLHNAGVGKLYTREFFELARDRLSPDGMISLYASTGFSPAEFAMVVRTFQQVFPHSSLWIDRIYGETTVLLGSMKKLSIDLPSFLDKAMHPPVRADLAELGLEDPGVLLSSFLMGEEILRVFARDADLNSDDRPLLEFFSLEREPFANDDRVVSDLGWGLHRDSVIRILDRKHPHPLSASTLETIEASTRVSALLLDHLVYLWSGDGGHSAAALMIASSLDKKAEFLRTATGTGIEALADAEDRMARHPSAENVVNLALLKAARGDCAGALPLLQRALGLDDSRLGRDPRSALHLVAARCLRELGRLEAAREQLRDASRLGSETSLEEAELALAESVSGDGCRLDLLDAKAQAAFGRGDVAAAHEAFLGLESCGRRRPSDLARHAQLLEASGDHAGAYLLRRDVVEGGNWSDAAERALERSRLELALRMSLLMDAFSGEGGDPIRLSSPFGLGEVSSDELRPVDHRSPDSWLRLSELYLEARLPSLAYRKARAARTLAPDRAAAYVAIGHSAEAMGDPSADAIARTAYERAVAIDPGGVDGKHARLRLQNLERR